ncbi:MAG: DNA photolyase family protein [Burkholderiales bacterium]|jgi:deoxyribodipyrimidine photo-lyase|nr:DNA photolyase family protein [Burkholderiales bacterium]
MPLQHETALVWFRRDLRADDHAALYHALRGARRVFCAFCFDTEILDALPSREDRRVEFIWHAIVELDRALRTLGGGLVVLHGRARDEIPRLATRLGAQAVFVNRDYEPAARDRDTAVARSLAASNIAFHAFKDQAIFDADEILTQAGRPFSVFTPYKNAWLKKVDAFHLRSYPIAAHAGALAKPSAATMPSLAELGFRETDLRGLGVATGMSGAERLFEDFRKRMDAYRERRDFPAVKGPSYLSPHLRFGTISVRRLAREAHAAASEGAMTWLSELIWRDFYFQILHHHPHVAGHAFRREYEHVAFDNDEAKWQAWCDGRTGYPIVDAAMRQINATGYMHNRLRMIAASFLVKDLHVDWRRGERYFADRLLDFDLAANNGGWQWAASTGCDAQPYFRIFNPITQSQKFDPEGRFIRRYVPELANLPPEHIHAPWMMPPAAQQACGVTIGRDYPAPVVDHDWARKLTLERYKRAAGRGAAD